MRIPALEQLPKEFRVPPVKETLALLKKRRVHLVFKRLLDLILSLLLILVLSPLLLILMLCVKLDSRGPVFFLQERVGRYGKPFRIFKFRTMVPNAEALGAQVTRNDDPRITRVGHRLRALRLDEIPQLFNILVGQMSFVGTRPEVPRYVAAYDEKMMTTLLLPPGLTSMTSIRFRDEATLLKAADNPDQLYIETILPQKMAINEQYAEKAGPLYDIGVLFKTFTHVFLKRSGDRIDATGFQEK